MFRLSVVLPIPPLGPLTRILLVFIGRTSRLSVGLSVSICILSKTPVLPYKHRCEGTKKHQYHVSENEANLRRCLRFVYRSRYRGRPTGAAGTEAAIRP